jgi:mycofactocin glycosyltransferase
VIPLIYALRKGITFENAGNTWTVISGAPLTILRVSERASQVLRLCDGGRTVTEVAAAAGMSDEDAYRLCDYFNRRAILETRPARGGDFFPSLSVIIPTKDRREDIAECLDSVFAQEYPRELLEVIVIDDGSGDGTGDVVSRYPATLLTNRRTLGQSYCRNLGAGRARGDVLAFLDSDCVADRAWLRELVTYFRWDLIGAVGGYVDGYFEESALDRYEKAFSSLNMGRYILHAADTNSTVYSPMCNLLVRREVFMETGGIREEMRVGEDVDFCWRLRKAGHGMLYVPRGTVRHKHRNRLMGMLKRRGDYGTSEALLYELHPDKKKTFQVPFPEAVAFAALIPALLFLSVLPLLAVAGCLAYEWASRVVRTRRAGVHVPLGRLLLSVLRGHFSFYYFVSFHLIRYYTVPMFLMGFFFNPLWLLWVSMFLIASTADYAVKKPRLVFPVFLCYYCLEQVSYQIGVFAGCLQRRNFGSYVPRFFRRVSGVPSI